MAIRMTNSSSAMTLMKNLRKSSADASDQLEKLSSGKRVNKASDGVADLAIGTKLDSFTKSLRQAGRNVNDGISWIQTAEGGLNEIGNILIRMRELSLQAATDTVGESERGFINKEYTALLDEVDRIAETTSFNGTNVLNGEKGVLDFQVGAFARDENIIQFDTENTHAGSDDLGIGGSSIDSKGEAKDNIESLDNAITSLSERRAELGASQNRLNYAANNIENLVISHEETKSKMIDVDVAESTAKLVSANIRKESAVKTLQVHQNLIKTSVKLLG